LGKKNIKLDILATTVAGIWAKQVTRRLFFFKKGVDDMLFNPNTDKKRVSCAGLP